MHFAALEGVSENQIIISKKDKRINRFDTPGSINARITDIFGEYFQIFEKFIKSREFLYFNFYRWRSGQC